MTIVGKQDVDSLTEHLLNMRSCNIEIYGHCLGQIRRMAHGDNCGPGDYRGKRSIREISYPGYLDSDFKEVLRRLGEDNLPLL